MNDTILIDQDQSVLEKKQVKDVAKQKILEGSSLKDRPVVVAPKNPANYDRDTTVNSNSTIDNASDGGLKAWSKSGFVPTSISAVPTLPTATDVLSKPKWSKFTKKLRVFMTGQSRSRNRGA